jgi:hypothetical protein
MAQASAVVTPIKIQAQLQRVGDVPEWIRQEIRKQKVQLIPAGRGISFVRYWLSKPLHIVFGMVARVLLLACVNLRETCRRPEFPSAAKNSRCGSPSAPAGCA